MKKQRLCTFVVWALAMVVVGPSFAADGGSNPPAVTYEALKGYDLSAAVQFYGSKVQVLSAPVYVWNWFESSGRSSLWASQLSAFDSAASLHAANLSALYWQNLCTQDSTLDPADCSVDSDRLQHSRGNMMGPGLYAALDPVDTASFGGSSGDWVLLQVRLPTGLRYVDLNKDGYVDPPAEVANELKAVGCGKQGENYFADLGELLDGSSFNLAGVNATCKLAIRQIFKENLALDAIYYSYGAIEFKECRDPAKPVPAGSSFGVSTNYAHQAAFVIMNTTKMSDDDFRIFNAQTIDDKEDRVRIQSLFYKADADQPTASNIDVAMRDYAQKKYPGCILSTRSDSCSFVSDGVYTCALGFYGDCNGWNGSEGATISLAAPSKISTAKIPSRQMNQTALLWSDLDGTAATDPTQLSQWVSTNIMRCKP